MYRSSAAHPAGPGEINQNARHGNAESVAAYAESLIQPADDTFPMGVGGKKKRQGTEAGGKRNRSSEETRAKRGGRKKATGKKKKKTRKKKRRRRRRRKDTRAIRRKGREEAVLESNEYNFKRSSFSSKVNRSGILLPELSLTSNTVLQGTLLEYRVSPCGPSQCAHPPPAAAGPGPSAFLQCCTA